MRQARHKNLTTQFTKAEAKMTSMFWFSSWFGMAVAWQLEGTIAIALHGSAICINFSMGVVQ